MVEIRGLGIRRIEFEPVAVVGLVVDLAAADTARNPKESAHSITIDGIEPASARWGCSGNGAVARGLSGVALPQRVIDPRPAVGYPGTLDLIEEN